ncbi:hypothetical protein J6590_037032 [Homalodisca vitripennis]|nr:hypothetical protein J6590_037032 [Homalodisca vitripennis]
MDLQKEGTEAERSTNRVRGPNNSISSFTSVDTAERFACQTVCQVCSVLLLKGLSLRKTNILLRFPRKRRHVLPYSCEQIPSLHLGHI